MPKATGTFVHSPVARISIRFVASLFLWNFQAFSVLISTPILPLRSVSSTSAFHSFHFVFPFFLPQSTVVFSIAFVTLLTNPKLYSALGSDFKQPEILNMSVVFRRVLSSISVKEFKSGGSVLIVVRTVNDLKQVFFFSFSYSVPL